MPPFRNHISKRRQKENIMDVRSMDETYVADTYARFPVLIKSGKGSLVTDIDGKEYIDLGSGIGVTAFGMCDTVWVDSVRAQLEQLQHTSNLYYTEPCAKLAKLLCEKTGMKKVFFCNSGAEANECAIKTARKYAEDKGIKDGVIVTLKNSFHGRTITTLSATGQDHYHASFLPMTAGFVHADPNDPESTARTILENRTIAVMIECIQGEGGVNVLDYDYVKGIYDLCRKHDILLIVDEVQTGNGRTGKLYAYMNYDIEPDIVSTAKGLGGGLPIGAALLGKKVEHTLGHGDHGSTFGGNPVCCAGAYSILKRLDEPFLKQVCEKGDFIRQSLKGCEGVELVTGLGLMIGIKTTKPARDVIAQCLKDGVLCLSAKDRVRLLPALNIPMQLLEKAVSVIKNACRPDAQGE